jgi:hypothetical protein
VAFLTEARARAASPYRTRSLVEAHLRKSAATDLSAKFDVFLSHSRLDAEVILGVKNLLEGEGLRVYVDWVEDQQLDRSRVTAKTAEVLRIRMRNSQSLIFATSESSPSSKWMPWELGYFDGFRPGYVAILPLVTSSTSGFVGILGPLPVFGRHSAAGRWPWSGSSDRGDDGPLGQQFRQGRVRALKPRSAAPLIHTRRPQGFPRASFHCSPRSPCVPSVFPR